MSFLRRLWFGVFFLAALCASTDSQGAEASTPHNTMFIAANAEWTGKLPNGTIIDATALQVILDKHLRWILNLTSDPREQADLRKTDLSNTSLVFGNLSKASLSNANLSNANLWNTHLRNAYLLQANLTKADLRLADLCNAKLTESTMNNAKLNGADLSGATLFSCDAKRSDPV